MIPYVEPAYSLNINAYCPKNFLAVCTMPVTSLVRDITKSEGRDYPEVKIKEIILKITISSATKGNIVVVNEWPSLYVFL